MLPLVDWRGVEWSDGTIRLPRAGMEIDLGGIGKEYAADRVATIAIDLGIPHGFVNLAGDVRVWGGRPGGAPWTIGIRHPRVGQATVGGIEITDGAVATSGDYERSIVVDGRRYGHILDATTGWPVDAWQSMSVVAPLCVVAGSGATVGMLLGDAAPAWLDAEGYDWLGVDRDGRVKGSETTSRRAKGSETIFARHACVTPASIVSDPITAARRTRCLPGPSPASS